MSKKNDADKQPSKSWFCVLPNPKKYGYTGTPAEIAEAFKETWIKDNPQRTCAITYCISADGLKHLHAVLEDTITMRLSKIQKIFPKMHIEATKGNKEQAENYINKRPPFDEQGEQVLYTTRHGDIKGRQGQRRDLDIIEELIIQGMTPNEIMDLSISYRKHEKIIRDAYYRKRAKETPVKRDIKVFWHCGEAGTGKSHTFVQLAECHGEDNIYFVGEYERGFDKYNGEPILILDEFRGQIKYENLLIMLGGYKTQTYARYTNVVGLWDEIHITSVFAPDILYESMIKSYRTVDTFEQLKRRISTIVYHYQDANGEFCTFEMPMSKYKNFAQLKKLIENTLIPFET
jgi:hypothetical protein